MPLSSLPEFPERNPGRIRVLVVDDHAGVRQALISVLRAFDDLELAGEAAVAKKALPLCARLQPDVVLMDLVMPGMSGVEAIYLIRERWPQIRVIALTSFQDVDLAQEALRVGAVCCLLKNVSAGELADAIRAASGNPSGSFSPKVDPPPSADLRSTYAGPDLSPRERAVLAMMAAGLNMGQIAEQLAVNALTARFHVENVLLKLGVTNSKDAVAMAHQHRLLD